MQTWGACVLTGCLLHGTGLQDEHSVHGSPQLTAAGLT